jgi:hypothetical protein
MVKHQPGPIELSMGKRAAVDAAAKQYCTMYLVQTTSARSVGTTSVDSVISLES